MKGRPTASGLSKSLILPGGTSWYKKDISMIFRNPLCPKAICQSGWIPAWSPPWDLTQADMAISCSGLISAQVTLDVVDFGGAIPNDELDDREARY